MVVNADGETVANYRKSHLYYTDETWALEGSGFYSGLLPGLPRTAMGICMDIKSVTLTRPHFAVSADIRSPYRFEVPWNHFEFANHVLDSGARLVVVSMAWLTQAEQTEFISLPHEPDLETLTYWVSRLEPIIRFDSPQEIIVVFANRTGTEDAATYAGTSAVVGIKSGEVRIYGILGRGEKELLVVDTDSTPLAKLVYQPEASGFPTEADGQSPIRGDDDAMREPMGQGSDLSSGASTGFESDDKNGASTGGKQLQSSLAPPEDHQRGNGQRYSASPALLSPTESHFSVSSMNSSRLYWVPLSQSKSPMHNARRPTPRDELRAPEHVSSARRQENRWSIRSDVSVWNNQPGRPRDMAYPMTMPSESSFEDTNTDISRTPFEEGFENTYRQPTDMRYQTRSAVSQQPRQRQRTQPPKRSVSATHDALGLHMPREEPERYQEEAAHDPVHDETARWIEATAATVGRANSRQGMRSQPSKHTGLDHTVQRQVASAKPAYRSNHHEPSGRRTADGASTRKQSRRIDDADPPILQPASHGRVLEGAGAEPAREIKRPSTDMERRSARNLRRDYMHSAHPRNDTREGVRASSRGRQRSTTAPLGQPTDSPSRPARHRSAQNSRGRHDEPVDLSQFQMIEDYPSANCPVHGSRSQSGQRGPSSRRETPVRSRRRSSVREGGRHREASQDVSSPPTRTKASSRSSVRRSDRDKDKDKSYTTSTSAATGSNNNGRQLASRASVANLGYGPKTPVAMVFVPPAQGSPPDSGRGITPLKCVDSGIKTTLSRPRSAVW
jgi:predicted amidohydrolase